MKLKLFIIGASASFSVFFLYQHYVPKQDNEGDFRDSFSFHSVDLKSAGGSECKCPRFFDEDKNSTTEPFLTGDEVGTCSRSTSALKLGQRVVSFSFYHGHTYDLFDRDYFSGIRKVDI